MGESLFSNLAKRQLWCTFIFVMLSVSFTRQALCQQACQIQHCNAEYLALSSSSPPSSSSSASSLRPHQEALQWLPAPLTPPLDPCEALRGYLECTKRTARSCRGNLLFHSALYRIKELLAQLNCSSEGPGYPLSGPGAVPSTLPAAPHSRPTGSALCDYERRTEGLRSTRPDAEDSTDVYVHCGMFGDPHLRTFWDQFQTCKLEGAWPLLDTPYLTVQVTNTPVLPGMGPTAITKITVIFKAFGGCTEQKVYQATADADDLPLAFTDGSRSSADGNSLRVNAASPHGDDVTVHVVQLRATHAGASILVRHTGRTLAFSARLPEATLGLGEREGQRGEEAVGLQLCLHGCPRAELLQEYAWAGAAPNTVLPLLPQPPTLGQNSGSSNTQWARARAECSQLLPEEDFYFQACVFDLQASADAAFSRAALWASRDLKTLFPSMLPPRNLSRTAVVSGDELRSNTREATMSTLSVCLVLVLLFA